MATKTTGHQTTDQVAQKAHEAVDWAAETAGKAEDQTRECASHAEERVREAASQGRERADALVGRVNGYVRKNPLISIGFAFLAGAIYSALTRRR